jgi:hypothetical protein
MVQYGQPYLPQKASPATAPTPLSSSVSGDYSDRALAEAWARSTGLVNIPPKPPEFNALVCLLLAFFVFIVGGLVYYVWCEVRKNAYNASVSEALRLWKAHGSPDPYTPRVAVASPVQQQVDKGLSDKLQELVELKAKGLLSDEEFLAAKRKLLGI